MPGAPAMPRVACNPPDTFHIVKEYLDAIEEKMSEVLGRAHSGSLKKDIWAICRLHHQRSRYIFAMYKDEKIDADLYKYLCRHRFVDQELVSRWKRGGGYENLCCLRCIDPVSKNNTVCVCRVPEHLSGGRHEIECDFCGCRGCAGY